MAPPNPRRAFDLGANSMPNRHQRLIRNQICNAGFPYVYRQQAEQKILDAIWNLRIQGRTAKYLYGSIHAVRTGERESQVGAGRPSKIAQTTYLISVLNTVWMQGTQKKPTINRRGSNSSKFMLFAEPILISVGIFNAIDNVNRFNSYRNRIGRIIDRRGSVLVTMQK